MSSYLSCFVSIIGKWPFWSLVVRKGRSKSLSEQKRKKLAIALLRNAKPAPAQHSSRLQIRSFASANCCILQSTRGQWEIMQISQIKLKPAVKPSAVIELNYLIFQSISNYYDAIKMTLSLESLKKEIYFVLSDNCFIH